MKRLRRNAIIYFLIFALLSNQMFVPLPPARGACPVDFESSSISKCSPVTVVLTYEEDKEKEDPNEVETDPNEPKTAPDANEPDTEPDGGQTRREEDSYGDDSDSGGGRAEEGPKLGYLGLEGNVNEVEKKMSKGSGSSSGTSNRPSDGSAESDDPNSAAGTSSDESSEEDTESEEEDDERDKERLKATMAVRVTPRLQSDNQMDPSYTADLKVERHKMNIPEDMDDDTRAELRAEAVAFVRALSYWSHTVSQKEMMEFEDSWLLKIPVTEPFGVLDKFKGQGLTIAFEVPADDAKLVVKTSSGADFSSVHENAGVQGELNDVEPFRIELKYNKPPDDVARFGSGQYSAFVNWAGGKARIPLSPTRDPKVFISKWHYLGTESARNRREMASLYEANSPRTLETSRELFSGKWNVTQSNSGSQSGSSTYGMASVGADGKSVNLFLKEGDKTRQFRAFEVSATRDREEGKHTLTVRFDEVGKGSPRGIVTNRGKWPPKSDMPGEGYVVRIPDDARQLKFEAAGNDVDMSFAATELQKRFRVLLLKRSSGRLAGEWKEEKPNGEYGPYGQQSWTKKGEGKIERIIVLDDQYKRHTPGAVMDKSYVYPFAGGGDAYIQAERALFIYGHNLPVSFGDAISFRSDDENISYELLALPGEGDYLFEQGWSKAKVKNKDELTALVAKAKLKRGVISGVKGLGLNHMSNAWHLDFANATGKLYFAHQRRENEFTATDIFYSSDVGYIVVDESVAIPHKGLPLIIKKNGKPIGDGKIFANRIGSPKNAEYRTQPIRIYRSDRRSYAPPVNSAALSIDVKSDDVLEVAPADPFLLRLSPPKARVRIVDNPSKLGKTWKEALRRMAACHGDTEVDFNTITHKEAERYSKFILTELKTRDVRITKGDHAAAILIRDEFVKMMREGLVPAYSKIADGNDLKIAAFIQAGRRLGGPFWTVMKGRDGRGKEVRLGDMLDTAANARDWQMTPAQAEAHLMKEARKALKKFVVLMNNSVKRAEAAGNCNIMELMVIAGQDAKPVVARILPRLVKLADDPKRQYWVPDLVAQSYVSGLHTTGAAIRALEQYSRIDDAYKSMAVALASGGVAFVVSGMGYASAAAYMMVGADLADMAYFGGKGIMEYYEGLELVNYATGAAPAVGDSFLTEAELLSSEWYTAAIGALAPGFGAGMGIRQLRQLKNAARVARGARLAGQLDSLDEVALAGLTAEQRIDLAAHYTDLVSRGIKEGGTPLSQTERATLAKFDEYFNSGTAGTGKNVASNTNPTRPRDTTPPKSTEGGRETPTSASSTNPTRPRDTTPPKSTEGGRETPTSASSTNPTRPRDTTPPKSTEGGRETPTSASSTNPPRPRDTTPPKSTEGGRETPTSASSTNPTRPRDTMPPKSTEGGRETPTSASSTNPTRPRDTTPPKSTEGGRETPTSASSTNPTRPRDTTPPKSTEGGRESPTSASNTNPTRPRDTTPPKSTEGGRETPTSASSTNNGGRPPVKDTPDPTVRDADAPRTRTSEPDGGRPTSPERGTPAPKNTDAGDPMRPRAPPEPETPTARPSETNIKIDTSSPDFDKSLLTAKAGTDVTDPRPFGMMEEAMRHFQETVDKFKLRVRVRGANTSSLKWMRRGHPPKHVKLKAKTINDLDVELGAAPGSQGMVGYFLPKKPANYDQLSQLPDPPKIVGRYKQRLNEYWDNWKDMERLKQKGLIDVEGGVVIDRGLSSKRLNPETGELDYFRGPKEGTGKGFTGDYDMWDITHPDGRPIITNPDHPGYAADAGARRRKEALLEELGAGPANTQHGPHKDWTPLNERDRGIDARIRDSHRGQRLPDGSIGPLPKTDTRSESEALLEFGPGRQPSVSYEIDPPPTADNL